MTTVKADSRKRVVLPGAKPGDCFRVQISGTGNEFRLTLLEPVQRRPNKVRLEKRGGYTVGVTARPIDEEALKQALAEFP
jgi:hypothetical protein